MIDEVNILFAPLLIIVKNRIAEFARAIGAPFCD